MKDRDVGGAVYVYINKAGRWEKIAPIRLNGTKDSMFGLAVENIGDVNQDSYEGNLAVILELIYVLSISCCHITVNDYFLIQTLPLELLMMTAGQEKSTFIMALHKESTPVLHRSAFLSFMGIFTDSHKSFIRLVILLCKQRSFYLWSVKNVLNINTWSCSGTQTYWNASLSWH